MNRRMTSQLFPRPITMGLVAGLLCCLPSNNLYPQTSVETNVVVVSDGSSPTNASPGYAGAWGEDVEIQPRARVTPRPDSRRMS